MLRLQVAGIVMLALHAETCTFSGAPHLAWCSVQNCPDLTTRPLPTVMGSSWRFRLQWQRVCKHLRGCSPVLLF